MSLIEFLLFVAVGCGAGFLAGLFGVGGGILMVPVLIFSYEHSGLSPSVLTHMALGTSLFVIVFTSVMSAYQHGKQSNIDWRSVFVIGIPSALTAFGISKLASWLSGKHLQIAFAIMVMITAVKMLTESQTMAEKKLEWTSRPNNLGLAGVGCLAGMVASLAGIGGGVVTIPMMYYFLGMPLKLAVGTSSATIIITALFSAIGYIYNGMGRPGLPEWNLGFVDLQRGVALAIGTICLARTGAYVSFKTHPFLLRKLFAVFILLVSLYMLFK